MNRLFSTLQDGILGMWRRVRSEGAPGALALLRPIAPFSGPDVLAPVVAFGVLLTMSVVSGVALAALTVLLLALFVLYLICTEILGIQIEVQSPPR